MDNSLKDYSWLLISMNGANKMNVLIVSQYFWPEMMRVNDLAAELSRRGHDVTVLTGVPNYPEGRVYPSFRRAPKAFSRYAGARIVRVPMLPRGRGALSLTLNYLSYCLCATLVAPLVLRGKHFDNVFVYAVSPISVAVPAVIVGRLKRAPVLVWVLDLWPETLSAVGVVHRKWVLALVGKLVSWIYNRSDYLLLQSRAFRSCVQRYCSRAIDPGRLVYFPSWAEAVFDTSVSASRLLPPEPASFTVLFAGNVGESQDFPSILEAAEQLRGRVDTRWVIVGDGRMYAWVAREVARRGLTNVLLLGRHPMQEMPGLYATADALLVSLKTNETFAKTIPGKLQSYLAAGRPVLAMIDGEAADVIESAGAGFVCPAGDAQGLAAAVESMAALSEAEREQMGVRARTFYQETFARELLLDRLEALMRRATRRRS